MVTADPRRQYARLKPVAEYAAAGMADLGISSGEVLLAADPRQMVQYLRDGRVDWVTETVFGAFRLQEEAGAILLLRRWKDGVAEYRSLFITRRSGDIEHLGDLPGRTVAFEDRGSTTAYFAPAAALREAGHDLVELESAGLRAPEGKVGFVFARSEVNIAVWAARGIVAAGALDSVSWDDPGQALRAARADLRVFQESTPLPRAVELVRNELDPAVRDRLRSVLLAAHLDGNATAALAAYSQTRRFDEFAGVAADRLAEARRTFDRHRTLFN